MRSLERKEDIRRRILKLRMDLDASEWECGTQSIAKRIREHAWFAEARMIFCYVDFRGEVGMRGLIEEAWRAGKRVCVPRMDGERMDFYEISSFSELGSGTFGIMEPTGEAGKDRCAGGSARNRERNVLMMDYLPKDPVMLLSVVNTKIRDEYHTLDALCEDIQADRETIVMLLKEIDYEYDESLHQFV